MMLRDYYTVVVSGTREWRDADKLLPSLTVQILKLKDQYKDKLLVVSGEADGIDNLTQRLCEKHGIWFAGVPAPWKRYHNGAGPKRNEFMLDVFQPQLLIACHPNLKMSKGTKNCVKQAKERRIRVQRIYK